MKDSNRLEIENKQSSSAICI